MVPDPNDGPTGPGAAASGPEPDGGPHPGFDEATIYRVVRAAVGDAILEVLGTLLVGVTFVLVVAGGRAAVGSDSAAGTALGVVVALGGLYLAAAALEVVPPAREWL